MDNYFKLLNDVDVSEHIEKKGKLSYLSWAWAWKEIKLKFPDAYYTIYKNADGWFYHTDGKTAWVETGVTVNGLEHIEMLPVMDYNNKSITTDKITSFDVNKAIQRSLTKACARHGLGLYIYAGEDLPESEKTEEKKTAEKKPAEKKFETCENCGNEIKPSESKSGLFISRQQVIKVAQEKYGKALCAECMEKMNESKD